VGCGGHVLCLPGSIKRFARVDPGHPDADYDTPMHRLHERFGAGEFDVVSSFDVLEHLIPEELDTCIEQLWTLAARRVIVSVGTGHGGLWKGKTVHLTIQPTEWWMSKLGEVTGAGVLHVATAKKTSPFFVIDKG